MKTRTMWLLAIGVSLIGMATEQTEAGNRWRASNRCRPSCCAPSCCAPSCVAPSCCAPSCCAPAPVTCEAPPACPPAASEEVEEKKEEAYEKVPTAAPEGDKAAELPLAPIPPAVDDAVVSEDANEDADTIAIIEESDVESEVVASDEPTEPASEDSVISTVSETKITPEAVVDLIAAPYATTDSDVATDSSANLELEAPSESTVTSEPETATETSDQETEAIPLDVADEVSSATGDERIEVESTEVATELIEEIGVAADQSIEFGSAETIALPYETAPLPEIPLLLEIESGNDGSSEAPKSDAKFDAADDSSFEIEVRAGDFN